MQRWNQHSRVNLAELKTQIFKRIGAEKTRSYFYYLNQFLNLKLNKVEFDKLCFRVLGRENISLHNQLICSILRNSCTAKTAPTPRSPDKEVPTSRSDGSHTFPNGNVDLYSHRRSTTKRDNEVLEDGVQKLAQHHQVVLGKGKEAVDLFHNSILLQAKQSIDGSVHVQSKEQSEVSVLKERRAASTNSSLVAPLGIPFCSKSVGGARKPLTLASNGRCASTFDTGGLLDLSSLTERMQQIAASQGLEGVSTDSANLLSSGLDAYLKGLLNSCIDLVGARRACDLMTKNSHKRDSHGKLINGFMAGQHMPLQNSRHVDEMNEQRSHFSISLLDFKIAMELNPQQLGEAWPLLLEKITHAFEE